MIDHYMSVSVPYRDPIISIKGDRYFCLTSLAVCVSCMGCDKKGDWYALSSL